MFDPQRFDEVERVTAFQAQIKDRQMGLAFFHEPSGVGDVIRGPDASEVRFAVHQLHEPSAHHWMVLHYKHPRFWLLVFSGSHKGPQTAGCASKGTRQ